ncbi:MAG: hypothetical protein KatS3mg060_1150 [Dehalococcoidia bacterium]|nr:MAG: hypothetical protein KatS3mg060_1150 [Dehalococcoidia bacterium]
MMPWRHIGAVVAFVIGFAMLIGAAAALHPEKLTNLVLFALAVVAASAAAGELRAWWCRVRTRRRPHA